MAKAHFTDISVKIKSLLEESQHDIKVAVAWFTNPFLFRVLGNLLDKEGMSVRIIISDSPHNFDKLDFAKLIAKGAEVHVCLSESAGFMHNKFCIIDDRKILSGSYNWSLNAEKCFENVVEVQEDNIVRQFNILFSKIREHSVPYCNAIKPQGVTQGIEAREDNHYYNLQRLFAQRVDESIRETLRIGVPINTDNLYELINKYSAIGAAKMLTTAQEGKVLQPGFKKLARRGRLELTFEWLITQPEFEPLFSPSIIQYAQNKLERGRVEAQLPPEPNRY